MGATLSRGMAKAGHFIGKEIAAAWPVFQFFLVGFLLLILLIKLALAQFSIQVVALSNAVVGALIAAKATIVLDETPLARSLERHRRIVAVAVKTFFYGTACLLLGFLERFLEALHTVRSFDGAMQYVVERASIYRLLAWTFGISIVFALYFSFLEISRSMGEGALRTLFFGSPAARSSKSPSRQARNLKGSSGS